MHGINLVYTRSNALLFLSSLLFPVDGALVPFYCCIVFHAVSISSVFHPSTEEHLFLTTPGHLGRWPFGRQVIFPEDTHRDAAVGSGYVALPSPATPSWRSNMVGPAHIPLRSGEQGGVRWKALFSL